MIFPSVLDPTDYGSPQEIIKELKNCHHIIAPTHYSCVCGDAGINKPTVLLNNNIDSVTDLYIYYTMLFIIILVYAFYLLKKKKKDREYSSWEYR